MKEVKLKSVHELIQLLIVYIKEKIEEEDGLYYDVLSSGICMCITRMTFGGYITQQEKDLLMSIIKTNLPDGKYRSYSINDDLLYYEKWFWSPGCCWPDRLDYLEDLLIKYKDK